MFELEWRSLEADVNKSGRSNSDNFFLSPVMVVKP